MALTDNLVAYYKMDETSWTTMVNAVSPWTLDWTITSVTVNQTGKIWKAYTFSDSQYVSLWNNFNYTYVDSFSFSCWYKSTDNTNEQYLIAHAWGSVWQFQYWFETYQGTVSMSVWTNTNTSKGSWVNDGNWHHLVGTNNWSEARVYIDWVDKWTCTRWTNTYSTSTYMWKRVDWNWTIRWTMDEFWIWNKALSAAEVIALYNSWNWLTYPFSTTSPTNASFLYNMI